MGGTDPFGALQPQQRNGVIGSLLGALMNPGVTQQQIMQGAGINTIDPRADVATGDGSAGCVLPGEQGSVIRPPPEQAYDEYK